MIHRTPNPKRWVSLPPEGLNDARLSWQAKGLLAYLLAKPDDWEVRLDQLVSAANDGVTTVRSILRELTRYGYARLVSTRNANNTRTAGMKWEIWDMPQNTGEDATLSCRNPIVQKSFPIETLSDRNPIVQKSFPIENLTLPNINKKPNIEKKPSIDISLVDVPTETPKPAKPAPYSPGFLQFWALWPTERREAKPKCFAIWKQRGLEERASTIAAHIEALKATRWQGKDPQYIPLSLTWLNQGRYEDDMPTVAPSFTPGRKVVL